MGDKLVIQIFTKNEIDEIIKDIRKDRNTSLFFLNNMFLIFWNIWLVH